MEEIKEFLQIIDGLADLGANKPEGQRTIKNLATMTANFYHELVDQGIPAEHAAAITSGAIRVKK